MMATSTTTATTPLLTLRVDVQNLPRTAIENGQSGQMIIRVAPNLGLPALKNVIRDRLIDALLLPDTDTDTSPATASLDFDVEVYHAKHDRFQRLKTIEQLGRRRARLNIILLHPSPTVGDDGASSITHLALPSRMFGVNTQDGAFRINGHAILIGEVENSGLGTGLTTWDGSIVLAKYLEHANSQSIMKKRGPLLKRKRVIEVGAGTGLVGLSAAMIGGAQEVILTDLAYTMDNLNLNIKRTLEQQQQHDIADARTTVTAQVLDWFNPRKDFGAIDLILASDVVWVEELIPPLVNTLHTLVQSSSVPTTILMSHQQRSVVSDALLFRELDAHGFEKREIPCEDLHPDFVSDRIQIWEIRFR